MKITAQHVKDAMQYGSLIAESFTVAGVPVEIWHDKDVENPYHDCDGFAPALWLHLDGGLHEYGASDVESFFHRMSPAWVSRNWRKVAAILDIPESDVDTECRQILADFGGHLSDIRLEYFSERLSEERSTSWGYGCDYLDKLAALYTLAGIPAETRTTHGYRQGDVARGLIVHLPEWRDRVGFGGDAAADMDSEAAVYGAWLWGDTYGFTVGDECCGGFFGTDLDYVAESIAEHVNTALDAQAAAMARDMAAARPDLSPVYA